MSTVAVAALLRANPSGPFWAADWLDTLLTRHWPQFHDTAPRSWSVGTVLGNETLVQARPTVRESNGRFLADMLRTSAPCTLAVYGWSPAPPQAPVPPVGFSRFRRFIGAVDTGIHEIDPSALAADLPDFLARARSDRSDRELVFLTCLKYLHQRGALRGSYPDPDALRGALAQTRDLIGPQTEIWIHDGRTLALAHGSGTLVALEPPAEPGRRRSPTGDNVPTSGLLLRLPGEPLRESVEGAERMTPGVFTFSPSQPLSPTRTA